MRGRRGTDEGTNNGSAPRCSTGCRGWRAVQGATLHSTHHQAPPPAPTTHLHHAPKHQQRKGVGTQVFPVEVHECRGHKLRAAREAVVGSVGEPWLLEHCELAKDMPALCALFNPAHHCQGSACHTRTARPSRAAVPHLPPLRPPVVERQVRQGGKVEQVGPRKQQKVERQDEEQPAGQRQRAQDVKRSKGRDIRQVRTDCWQHGPKRRGPACRGPRPPHPLPMPPLAATCCCCFCGTGRFAAAGRGC